MRARDAKYDAIEWLERQGWEVYERRKQSPRALGQVCIVDPNSGGTLLVRTLHGKRPPRAKSMLRDRGKEGVCDAIAYVDPADGSVRLVMALPDGKQTQAA